MKFVLAIALLIHGVLSAELPPNCELVSPCGCQRPSNLTEWEYLTLINNTTFVVDSSIPWKNPNPNATETIYTKAIIQLGSPYYGTYSASYLPYMQKNPIVWPIPHSSSGDWCVSLLEYVPEDSGVLTVGLVDQVFNPTMSSLLGTYPMKGSDPIPGPETPQPEDNSIQRGMLGAFLLLLIIGFGLGGLYIAYRCACRRKKYSNLRADQLHNQY